MTTVDLDAIRERSARSQAAGPPVAGDPITAAHLYGHWESASDVPVLVAEVDRLRAELERERGIAGGYR